MFCSASSRTARLAERHALTVEDFERDGAHCDFDHGLGVVVELDGGAVERELLVLRVEEELDRRLVKRERKHLQERNEEVDCLLVLVELQVHADQLVDERVREDVVYEAGERGCVSKAEKECACYIGSSCFVCSG